MKLAFLKPHHSLGNMNENDWTKRKQIESSHRKRLQPNTINRSLMLWCMVVVILVVMALVIEVVTGQGVFRWSFAHHIIEHINPYVWTKAKFSPPATFPSH